MAGLKAWISAFRLKFLPQGVLPVILATALAWEKHGIFYLSYFILAFTGMALVQFALTMLNDTLDYEYGTDRSSLEAKNPYSGGSGVLVSGIIKPEEMKRVIAVFYILALLIGIYLAFVRGIEVIIIALLGFFISIFYSAKPLRFAYRGIGEFAMLLGYGPVITTGAYFVQSQILNKESFLIGLFPGLLMFAMIIINEIPDYEEDRRAGKRNIVSRVGREKGVIAFGLSLSAFYILLIALSITKVIPVTSLIALLSLPVAASAFINAKRYYRDRIKIARANERMVILYSTAMILLISGILLG